MNHSKLIAILLIVHYVPVNALSDEYIVNVAIGSRTSMMDMSSTLRVWMTRVDEDNFVIFNVTNCEYVVSQKINSDDVDLGVDIPSNVHLRESEGVLADIYNKTIVYKASGNALILKNDNTHDNSIIGPLSDWLSILVSTDEEFPSSLAGINISATTYDILEEIAPYHLMRRVLNDASMIETHIDEISIVNSMTQEKGMSRINLSAEHGDVFQRIDALVVRDAFRRSAGDDLNVFIERVAGSRLNDSGGLLKRSQ